MFPNERPRRLRRNETIRSMVRETSLSPEHFVYPMFVLSGQNKRQAIGSMPGIFRLSPDEALKDVKAAASLGIGSVLLFGIPDFKDKTGSTAWADEGPVQQTVRLLKDNMPDLYVITDVCLCEYTDHGHCGLIEDGEVMNDSTLELLSRQALSHAGAGADMVAPSDMMDGRVGYIRKALDTEGFSSVSIMSYAAKYAGAFYGPFRDAAGSAPAFGDRRAYQMDPANSREAIREVSLDIREGADIIMIKPAMPCLDIIRKVRDSFEVPLAAYQVSGEYAMIMAAGRHGWLDTDSAVLESLTAIRRAGADIIITYFASLAAGLLERGSG